MHTKSKIKTLSKILFTLLFSLSYISISFAQTSINTDPNNLQNNTVNSYNAASAFCPYTFTKNLSLGMTDKEVKVLQQILNTDSRTVVAQNGPASPGNETTYYGASTRDTIKKFQALFIEYIGIANGNFGPKTRTVMNAVCNSEYFLSGRGNVYSGISTQNTVNNNIENNSLISTNTDKIAPSIFLRSNSTAIDKGLSFRIIVNASEPILAFTNDSIIIENGIVSDLRKLSPTSYSLLVTPTENAKVVLAQVEADRVPDLAGNKNESASNEIRISIIQPTVVATTTTTSTGIFSSDLDSIFNKILTSVNPPTTKTTEESKKCPNSSTNYPDCDDRINNDRYSQNNQGQGGGGGLSQILSSLFGGNKQPQYQQPQYGQNLNQFPSAPEQGQTPTGVQDIGSEIGKTPTLDETKAQTDTAKTEESKAKPIGGKITKIYTCPNLVKTDGKIDAAQSGRKFYEVSNDGVKYTGLLSFKSQSGFSPKIEDGYKFAPEEKMIRENLKCCELYDSRLNFCKKEVSGTEGKLKFYPGDSIGFTNGKRESDVRNLTNEVKRDKVEDLAKTEEQPEAPNNNTDQSEGQSFGSGNPTSGNLNRPALDTRDNLSKKYCPEKYEYIDVYGSFYNKCRSQVDNLMVDANDRAPYPTKTVKQIVSSSPCDVNKDESSYGYNSNTQTYECTKSTFTCPANWQLTKSRPFVYTCK